ncbi:hypothetical protein [Falseniella ignava]|uniref:Uncharacterized protein n=1 Tax=Falseniella ignava CCUG 37419 TaxID=883112 RepID=K1MCL4_9LACT|nr:hypothetical protein [Falseniella ignava]EKB53729.1 hypothetical protein HMPREF9707_01482 [Falseniella ignava CCUG 37419]
METKRTVFPSALSELFSMIDDSLEVSFTEMEKIINCSGHDKKVSLSEKQYFIEKIIKSYEILRQEFDKLLFDNLNTLFAKYITDLILNNAQTALDFDNERVLDYFINSYYLELSVDIYRLFTPKKKEV